MAPRRRCRIQLVLVELDGNEVVATKSMSVSADSDHERRN